MTSEKEALLNFIGGVYGQMKEIDNHIAATGSGAKFANRSAELKNVFEQVAASTVVQQPAPPFIQSNTGVSVIAAPQQIAEIRYDVPAQPAQQPPPASEQQTNQLEFSFKEDANSILKDIYNVLFDIKKILIAQQNNQSNQNDKAVKKTKKYADCCLCGSRPAYSKDKDMYIMQCTGCNAKEVASSEQIVKTSWNNNNKRL